MPVLLSRYIDPVLGVFTGIFAYYLAENNPRAGLKPEQKLIPLVQWKLEKRKAELQALDDQNNAKAGGN